MLSQAPATSQPQRVAEVYRSDTCPRPNQNDVKEEYEELPTIFTETMLSLPHAANPNPPNWEPLRVYVLLLYTRVCASKLSHPPRPLWIRFRSFFLLFFAASRGRARLVSLSHTMMPPISTAQSATARRLCCGTTSAGLLQGE